MKRTMMIMLMAGAMTGCGGSGSPPPTALPTGPSTSTITATFTLYDRTADEVQIGAGHTYASTADGCKGVGGFDDIGPGQMAQLVGPDKTLLSSSDLGYGEVAPAADGDPASCVFTLTFDGVPHVPVATIKVADRGEQAFQWTDLSAGDTGLVLNAP